MYYNMVRSTWVCKSDLCFKFLRNLQLFMMCKICWCLMCISILMVGALSITCVSSCRSLSLRLRLSRFKVFIKVMPTLKNWVTIFVAQLRGWLITYGVTLPSTMSFSMSISSSTSIVAIRTSMRACILSRIWLKHLLSYIGCCTRGNKFFLVLVQLSFLHIQEFLHIIDICRLPFLHIIMINGLYS